MKLLFDFFPIILFFVAFKLWGIYAATVTAIVASFGQLAYSWLQTRRLEMMHVITFVLILVMGGATLLLHNVIYIKWKPSILYWVFAIVFFISQFIGNKPLIQRMMEKSVSLPKEVWNRLNITWVFFFMAMGFLNLYVIYHFSTNAWVYFKLFGLLGFTLAFIIVQAVYMARYIKQNED